MRQELIRSTELPQRSQSQYIAVTVLANQAELRMEVDTGASASVISEDTYRKIWQQHNTPPIQKTSIKLRIYTGESLKILGAIKVHQGQWNNYHYWLSVDPAQAF